MLSIRLTRTGKVHAPHYRIVVQEKRSKLNGKTIDTIGHYHPAQAGKLLVIDKEKAAKWLSVGAQPSDTVTNLMVKDGILDPSKKVHNFFTPVKKEAAPAAESTSEPIEEAAAEEKSEAAPEETA
jgi:small subunit ribosomal protein S16